MMYGLLAGSLIESYLCARITGAGLLAGLLIGGVNE
jgi:hypothetical protein